MKLKQLKDLKKTSNLMVDSSMNFKEFFCNIYAKTRKLNHRMLLKKIENSRLIYNRKEPLVIALKRAFILANKLEETLDLTKKVRIDRKLLIQIYMDEYKKVSKYSPKKLDYCIIDKHRLKRFNLCKWSVESIDIRDLGVWPSFGGTDKYTTRGNLVDTKNKILCLIKKKRKFIWPIKPSLPESTLSRLILEEKHADLVYKFYPIIVTAKGHDTRRIKLDSWTREKLGFSYKTTKYDIDDGNHRAIAFALFGIKKIKCFVGRGLATDRPK